MWPSRAPESQKNSGPTFVTMIAWMCKEDPKWCWFVCCIPFCGRVGPWRYNIFPCHAYPAAYSQDLHRLPLGDWVCCDCYQSPLTWRSGNMTIDGDGREIGQHNPVVEVINVWSGPRSLSTSLMYSFAQVQQQQHQCSLSQIPVNLLGASIMSISLTLFGNPGSCRGSKLHSSKDSV